MDLQVKCQTSEDTLTANRKKKKVTKHEGDYEKFNSNSRIS